MHTPYGQRLWSASLYIGYAALMALPILILIYQALRVSPDSLNHLLQANLSDYLFNTFALLPGVGFLALLLGVGLAWVTSAYQFPARRWLTVLLAIPICIPPFVHGFIYSELVGFGGPLHSLAIDWLGMDPGHWFNIRGLGGATVVFSLSLYPYIYLPTRLIFIKIIGQYRTAAGVLACGEFNFFLWVALPLTAGAILSSLGLIWMDVISDYGLVEYFGVSTISIGVIRSWHGLGNMELAALVALVALICVMLLLGGLHLCKRGLHKSGTTDRAESTYQPRRPGIGGQLVSFVICSAVTLITVIVPTGQLLVWVVSGWDSFDWQRLADVSINTLTLTVVSSAAVVVVCLLLCYVERMEYNRVWRGWYARLRGGLTLSYALPGVVVAVGVSISMAALNQWLGWAGNDFFILLIGLLSVLYAYQMRFNAVALNNFDTAFAMISRETDDTARTLGVGGFSLMLRIFMPILATPMRTVLILLSINLFKELPMTSFLRPIDFDTLAVDSFLKLVDERPVQAAPGALMIVLLSLAMFTLLLHSFSLKVQQPNASCPPT